MNVLIIEDERPASQKLIRLLNQIDPAISVLAELQSVEQAINWFGENPAPELIFMDIQLEDGTCFEIFESCKIETPIIFTTAFDEYTLKAFKVNSIDYLLKPIAIDDLQKAIDKYQSIHGHKTDYKQLENIISQLQPQTKERFLIKVGEHYRSVQVANIHCFYVNERFNFILTDNGRNYPIDHSLDKIEQMVDSRTFFRINRSCLVNIYAIKDIISYSSHRLKIVMDGMPSSDHLLVSRNRVSDFKAWMDR